MTATTSETFYSWLKHIPGELFDLDEKPLVGFPPPFPWQNFSAEISRSLQVDGISITPGELQWRTTNDLFDGLGDKLKAVSLNISPLNGGAWWVMPEQGYLDLMQSLLGAPPLATGEPADENLLKAFTQFLAAEAITAFQKIDFDKKLSPVVLSVTELPAEPCLALDVAIHLREQPIYGRLLLSSSFRKGWAARFAKDQKALITTSPAADALSINVGIEAGKVHIKPSEWQKITPGDFVVIDSCSLDPDEDKGRVNLVVNGQPVFRAKIKDGNIKILEHPLYHEVDTAMSTPPKDQEEEEFDDADFDIEEEKNDTQSDASKDDIDMDDFGDEDEEEKAEAAPKPQAAKPAAPGKTATAAATPTPAKASAAPAAPGKTGPLSVDEIPLAVVIEVGRIQLSVKKLLELQPGNMLELNIHPESGVDMVVNGKRIARGELLRIGDTLGLRVTELS